MPSDRAVLAAKEIQSLWAKADDDVIHVGYKPMAAIIDKFMTDASPITAGTQMVAVKRQRQIEKHGYDSAHDDRHVHYELARAGALLAWQAAAGDLHKLAMYWPFAERFMPDPDDIENLVNASAFIIAEIDRRLR
jgi:hypothetical protein